jgi:hypothetical protein
LVSEANKHSVFTRLDTISLNIATTGIFDEEVVFNYYFPDKFIQLPDRSKKIRFFEYGNFEKNYYLHYKVGCELAGSAMEITQRKLYKNIEEKLDDELRVKVSEWAVQQRDDSIRRMYPTHDESTEQELRWITFIIEYKESGSLKARINRDDMRIRIAH